VPFGYLWAVALTATGTVFALAPVRWPRPVAHLSYFLGLIVNEIAFFAGCWLVLTTALAFGQKDIDTLGGWAIVGLAAVVMAGLAVVARRGLRDGASVERAMTEGLGPDWGEAISPDLRPRSRRRLPPARILFWPFLAYRFDVRRVTNLRYGDAGRRNLLNVYRHRSRPVNAPVLIHMHGGGYHRGRKGSQSRPLLYRLASQGWVCVSANYRLRPGAEHPDHLIDLKKVIAWVRENGHEYGADPAVLFVAGSSAGAHMAALAALTQNDPVFQPGFEDADTSVTAAVCLNAYYGQYYGQSPESSPLSHITPDAPPFFIAHGGRDTLVPVEDARQFAQALRRTSANPVVYAELRDAHHAFDLFHSPRYDAVVNAVEDFAAWVRSREPASRLFPHT